MDQYVRVSRVAGRSGESFSLDLQREQGAAWAASRGVEVTVVHEDLDQSGGKLERLGLDALMERIRAGETDGMIVSKLDRLTRPGRGTERKDLPTQDEISPDGRAWTEDDASDWGSYSGSSTRPINIRGL